MREEFMTDRQRKFQDACLEAQRLWDGIQAGGRLVTGKDGGVLLEAGEVTSAANLPTLPAEVSAVLIRQVLPELLFTQIARVGVMKSTTKTIKVIEKEKYDLYDFGIIKHDTSWATNEAHPGTYALHLVAYVTEAVDATTVITVAGTDQQGTVISGTVTLLTTDLAGTYKDVVPSTGANTARWLTISGVTAAGWTSTGEINIKGEEWAQVAENTQTTKAGVKITVRTLTAVAFKLQTVLTSEVIEDARMALARDGVSGMDMVAEVVNATAEQIREEIDYKGLVDMHTAAALGAGNVSFSLTVPGGYTTKEWYATITDSLKQAKNLIKRKRYNAGWVAMHPDDLNFIERYCKQELTYAEHYGKPGYHDTGLIGRIAGLELYIRDQCPYRRMLVGAKEQGVEYQVYVPFELKGAVYSADFDTDARLLRQRSARLVSIPNTLATLSITA